MCQITGLVLNNSYYLCPTCSSLTNSHVQYIFGPPDHFRDTASRLKIPILAELPLVPGLSASGDSGVPYGLVERQKREHGDSTGGKVWIEEMEAVAAKVWDSVKGEPSS